MPDLVTIHDVELVKTGNWPAVTGPAAVTAEKIQSMIEASRDPAFSGAAMKVGHFDPRMKHLDGNPALGWIKNLRAKETEKGITLMGSLVDVPRSLAKLMSNAYKNRSIEWTENDTVGGKKYPAVLRGLALLGATTPGVDGLADVAALFASAETPAEGLNVAYVGENGERIVSALASLRDMMHADDLNVGHDDDGKDAGTVQGGTVATPEDVKAALETASVADLQAAIEQRRPAAGSTATPPPVADGSESDEDKAKAKATQDAADVEAKKAADAAAEAAKTAAAGAAAEQVTVSKAFLDDLAAKANAGAGAATELRETRLKSELQAASRQGKIIPTEFDYLLGEMLKGEVQEGVIRGMLSQRPQIVATSAIGSSNDSDTQMLAAAALEDVDAAFAKMFGSELASVANAAAGGNA